MITIDWQPAKGDPYPLYRQIFLYIKQKINTGEWISGSKLPPQRHLAEMLNVNRSTLRLAIDELIADGLLTGKVGSGIWVAENTWTPYLKQPVDWQNYLKKGAYFANLPLIQAINKLEFDPSIIRLGTGELSPDLLPTNELQQLLVKTAPKIKHYGYEEPKGLLHLREQISRHLNDRGIDSSPHGILVVSGALQALQLVLFGLLPSGSHLYFERPSYLSSLKLMHTIHAKFIDLPLDHAGIDLTELRRRHRKTPHSLLYTIPTFHNPTGTVMQPERRRQLVELCRELHLPILEDDVYRDTWLRQAPPPPLKTFDTTGNILYTDSLSKSIGPGLRIGWVAGPEPVIHRLADLKMQYDYGSSTLSQWLAAEWLAQGRHDDHLQRLRHQLITRQTIAATALQQNFSSLASWQIPSGGFYLWLHLHRPVSMTKLFKKALAAKILLNPGSLYDPLNNTALRISYAHADPSKLEAAIETLAHIVQTEYTATS